jgi:hypothetical protein
VFCVAILLATVVSSSPVETDGDQVEVSDIAAEDKSEPIQLFTNDSEPTSDDEATDEEKMDEEKTDEDSAVNEISDQSVIDEQDEGVPYQENPVDTPMSLEEMERIVGIEIPLCAQYPDNRNPLHLR